MVATQAPTGGGRWVALVGMMGAGKSTIGRRLARSLGVPFVDLDARIEAAQGGSIPEIFATQGEAAFRAQERACLEHTLRERPAGVLATGGGVVGDPANRRLLAQHAFSIYLEVPLTELVRRLSSPGAKAARPMLDASQDALRDRLESLLDARGSGYLEATLRVDAAVAPERVTQSILDALRTVKP